MPDTDHNEIREGLRDAASRRERIEVDRQVATAALKDLATRADEAGMTRTEIAELAGLTREGLYHVMGWRRQGR